MNNKNVRKIIYVSGNPQNAGFCTIYPTASAANQKQAVPVAAMFANGTGRNEQSL
jgi:hypothetical protein